MSTIPKRAIDIAGRRFGMLIAIEYVSSDNGTIWRFKCDCGSSFIKKSSAVVNGHVESCGCRSAASRFVGAPIAPGDEIGNITVVKMVGKIGHNISWQCACKCGKVFHALASNLTSGNTKSCGCHRRRVSAEKQMTHGLSKTRAYGLWKNMLRRCNDPKVPAYKHYGARGISVCERWTDFEKFFLDMGERPKGKSLERKNNALGYSPDNCIWATTLDQARNKRTNVLVSIGGVAKPISEWSESFGIPSSRIYARKKLGWTDDELLLPKNVRR